MEHNFGEKKTEDIKGVECPVWQTPKYAISKAKAIEIIESGKYEISDGDFWILMNTYAKGTKVMYTGLILSHNGCLKINDKLDDKFRAEFLHREWSNGSLIYEYNDGELYEVGEVSDKNCQNAYPYAMAFKRCFDRVVLKKSKLAFSGIYSEVEADEFKEKPREEEVRTNINKDEWEKLKLMYSKEEIKQMYAELNITKGTDIPKEYYDRKKKEYDTKFDQEHPSKEFY